MLKPHTDFEEIIALPPSEAAIHALGANHNLKTGIDELIDNAVDAGATNVTIVFQVEGLQLKRISIHDDGHGMSKETIVEVLRLGGHSAHSPKNIGRYGMGLKEGSFANSDHITILTRKQGKIPLGFVLFKDSYKAGELKKTISETAWRERSQLAQIDHGTTVIWDALTNIYRGNKKDESTRFISGKLEDLRKHVGIRYHRFLETNRLTINFYTDWNQSAPAPNPAVHPVSPFGYSKSGHRNYPKLLTEHGMVGAPSITAHIWTNRSKTDAFDLERRDDLGHQGFYIYDADRLITHGGWSGFQAPRKELKLLRIDISDPRIIEEYISISPQKGSVRFTEGFHRFINSFRSIEDPSFTLETAFIDSAKVLSDSNRRSAGSDPIARAGKGIDPTIKQIIGNESRLKISSPIDIVWGTIANGDFVSIERKSNLIVINKNYRHLFNNSASGINDAPVLKSLLFLLFNENISSGRRTGRIEANENLWISILNAAVRKQSSRIRE